MAIGAHATGTGFYSAAIGDAGPLQVRGESFDRCSHGMAAFDGFGIAFAANCTKSWHNGVSLKIALLVYQIFLSLARAYWHFWHYYSNARYVIISVCHLQMV
jgi:hypothetical protein